MNKILWQHKHSELEISNAHHFYMKGGQPEEQLINAIKPEIIILDDYNEITKIFIEKMKNCKLPYHILCLESKENEPLNGHTTKKEEIAIQIAAILKVKAYKKYMDQKFQTIDEQHKILSSQLELAKKIQRSFIKEGSLFYENVDMISRYMPAMDVGGDFFEIKAFSSHSLGIFICDVSGFGISAALLTSMTKILFKTYASEQKDAKFLLSTMNKELFPIFKNQELQNFITAFYIKIDTKKKVIQYSNAGHAAQIYVDHAKEEVKTLGLCGSPLGLFSESSYKNKSFTYENPSRLLLFTDGLIDSYYRENHGEFYETIGKEFKKFNGLKNEKLLDYILNTFYDNKNKHNDDVSIILCHLK